MSRFRIGDRVRVPAIGDGEYTITKLEKMKGEHGMVFFYTVTNGSKVNLAVQAGAMEKVRDD